MTTNFDTLVVSIADTSHYFQEQAQKQVNVALTLRNWPIGVYLVEYEQQGQDRADYGQKLLSKLEATLRPQSIKGLGETNLKLLRQFYMAYPQIGQTLSDHLPMMLQSGINTLYIYPVKPNLRNLFKMNI